MARRSSKANQGQALPIPDEYDLPYLTNSVAEAAPEKKSVPRRMLDSFKRDPGVYYSTAGGPENQYNMVAATTATACSRLQKKLKSRHLQMIAIGGSIGTGLFIGSGTALATAGPGSVLISFFIVGIMLYCTVHALGELAVLFPVAGSFSAYSTRFIHPSWGFAMGWNYAILWLTVFPLELVAASIAVDYWGPGVSKPIFITVFYLFIVLINLLGVEGYGEAEFMFSSVKVVAVIGFIVLGIVINCAGGPGGSYIGGQFWHDPGAFNNGFQGLCSVFVFSTFSCGGPELVGLAAAETAKPWKSLPTAIKQVFWRIILFYMVSTTIVGLLVPYTDDQLLGGAHSADANASPFVIAIRNAGLTGFDSIMNVVIIISVLSVANSSLYASTRTLAALADQGQAPQFLSYIDRKGRPLLAIITASSLGLLSYIGVSDRQQEAFLWMLAISSLSFILTWGSICLAHIRFRRAWTLAGRDFTQLAFKSQVGVVGSYIGLTINILMLMAQFWTAVVPVDYKGMSARERVESFFEVYLAAPVVIAFYVGHKLWFRTAIVRAREMDIDTGRRDFSARFAMERREKRSWPRWKRIYKSIC
ncbi:glyceraldehyde-3-phosphate dehydrogenase 1 [Arachnomyces sp. PD_36]|nr:glyceraldehyde-3-phosphate dehydrogenase 1 [Arachnomyces sp. PD_36]